MVFLANLFKSAFDIWLENASYEELADDHKKPINQRKTGHYGVKQGEKNYDKSTLHLSRQYV